MKKLFWVMTTLIFAAAFSATALQAQTNPIYFPYVVNDFQTTTELIFTNASNSPAVVTLNAYREDGRSVNPQSITLGAGSQVAVGSGVFPNLRGWVLALSDSPAVRGNLRVSSPNRSAQDTTQTSQPDAVVVIPFADQSAGASTEISVVNPTGFNARAILTLYDKDGRAIDSNELALAAREIRTGSLPEFFAGADYTNASHIVARSIPANILSSTANITGFEVIRNFARPAAEAASEDIGTRSDWSAMPAIAVSSTASSFTFPHVVRGMDWFSIIGLVNVGGSAQTVNLTYSTPSNPNRATRAITLPANGSIRMSAVELFGTGQDSGAVRVSGANGIAGYLGLGMISGASFAAAPAQAKAQTDFFFPAVDESSPAITGIALRNDGAATAAVDLYLMSAQGSTLGHHFESIQPQQQVVRLVREYFAEALNQTGGYVFAHSTSPLIGMEIVGPAAQVLNENTATAVPPGFVPPVQTVFAIRGRVSDSQTNAGIGGATIVLAKGRNTTATTMSDVNGDYIFGNLASGDYTVTLDDQIGGSSSVSVNLRATQIVNFTQYVIAGRVTDFRTGGPVSGVIITFSREGVADLITSTDANGYYAKILGPGDYIVTPSQTGWGFNPSRVAVSTATGGRLLNFTRWNAAPTIDAINVVTIDKSRQISAGNTPAGLPYAVYGTSEVSLKISGTNFVPSNSGQPAQQVFFGSHEIPSDSINILDSKTIYVKLLLDGGELLPEIVANGIYGRYDISVGGPSPFEEFRSNVSPFYIVPTVPILTGVEPKQTTARYEINSPGTTITLTGSGFRPGAQILFDGATALNGIEIDTRFVSSTQLTSYLPPQALRFGGIYSLRVRNQSLLPEISGEAVTLQVDNLRPEISSLDPAGPVQIIGPGTTPALLQMTINGSNFHPKAVDAAASLDPGTVVFITKKIPDIFPALVQVGGQEQCISVNGRTILRTRVFGTSGQPVAGVVVTYTVLFRGLDPIQPSGSFLPGNITTVTTTSDALGFAPAAIDNSPIFQANPFAGTYVVMASATVDGYMLQAPFYITNVNAGGTCELTEAKIVFVSSNQLIITQYAISAPGTYGIVVANNSPGGGVSTEKEFVVTRGTAGGVPVIRAEDPLSPPAVKAAAGSFNLTVYRDTSTSGSFQPDAWVNFGTVRLNRISGDTDPNGITVSVPALLISSPGTVPITVTNPATGGTTGGTSTRVTFTVNP